MDAQRAARVEGNSQEASSSVSSDRRLLERVAEDYIRGWYGGDARRLGRALHPDLVKLTPVDAGASFRLVTRQRMVDLTEQGGGKQADAKAQVIVDDVDEDIATARVESPDYRLFKMNVGWVLLGVL